MVRTMPSMVFRNDGGLIYAYTELYFSKCSFIAILLVYAGICTERKLEF